MSASDRRYGDARDQRPGDARDQRSGAAGGPRPGSARPSMQDVADRAGVSRATVSLVLSAQPGTRIAEATRARVRAAADELGYRRDLLARGLRRSRTDTIGLISDRITTSPWGWAKIAGAQDAAWERGRMLLIANTAGDAGHEREALDGLLDRRVDGLVLGAANHRALRVPVLDTNVPVVLLDAFDPEGGRPAVVPDDERGAWDATALLLAAGHRRIAFINSADPVPATTLRAQGHRAALDEHGVTFDPDLMVAVTDGATSEGSQRATEELLTRQPDVTALFCFNDRFASGAYRALRRLGRRVPEDVSVVGFDDQMDLAAGLDPPLTTIALPHEAMGRWAVNRLLDEIDGVAAAADPELRREHCPPVLRDSVAPPP
ncbi:MAG TPA: LacI family DNA-binding transcriptional regulator [Euzebyales bacterium]|nr:LacI family DNA-binding transcriptional regulator [Euzebyales bacterium]